MNQNVSAQKLRLAQIIQDWKNDKSKVYEDQDFKADLSSIFDKYDQERSPALAKNRAYSKCLWLRPKEIYGERTKLFTKGADFDDVK